jgi:hypothetical protein
MNAIPSRRRLAVALAATAALTAGTAAAGAAPTEAATSVARAGHPTTTLTFEMPGCDGCVVRLHQGREGKDPSHPTAWDSKEKKVADEQVRYRIQSRHTQGLSMTVVAPWEGRTGYLTTVAFRYGHEQVGDEVTFREARRKKWASACWEGTRRNAVTIPVVVREVMVQGVKKRVKGSIAYLPTTQAWLPPMREVRRGVLGSQEINTCI